MKSLAVPYSFLFVFSCLISSQARPAKVFFNDGRWLQGDVQTQHNESGKEEVVIAMERGSLTLPSADVKTIVYAGTKSREKKRFHTAFENTRYRSPPARPNSIYDPYIQRASQKYQMDPELVRAVIKQESNFNWLDVSNKGARGLMQLMPDTAKGLGVRDVFDPWENIHGGTRYLKMMMENFNGDLPKALAAYNAGPAAVRKYKAIPPYQETRGYVKNVLKYYRDYRGGRVFAFENKNGSLVFTDQPFQTR